MTVNIGKITKKGKALILAYDHGLEHGPKDFIGKNIDPRYILDIAKKAKFTAIALQKGVAEKYYQKSKDVPLIIKLNGKTNIRKGEPVSLQICSVKEAKEIGAVAVGYTIYLGSLFESEMMKEFGKIEEEAHRLGLPVIAWMYPRGKAVKKVTSELVEYAARVGLEIGADFVKVKYTGNIKSFKKVVKAAGKCKVVSLGGPKVSDIKTLQLVRDTMDSGASGIAIGRNVWQNNNPIKISRALRRIVIDNKSVENVFKK